jgi:cytoskeletal protein CcmA (bactofilin family)
VKGSALSVVTCVICGARKGAANKWWVLFEAENPHAVVIGPIEDAEALERWRQPTTRYNLCGAECLHRKLHAVLLPGLPAAGLRSPRDDSAATAEDLSPCPSAQAPWHNLLARHRKPPVPARAAVPADTTVPRNEKAPKLRENVAIGQGVTIVGQILSGEPLYFNGELTGTLDLPQHRLTVGSNARIRASVHAREIEIFGAIEGEVTADKIVIRKNARLLGNICAINLVIEEGAVFEGASRKAAESMPLPAARATAARAS